MVKNFLNSLIEKVDYIKSFDEKIESLQNKTESATDVYKSPADLLKKYKVLVQKIKYGKDTIHKKIVKEDNVYIPLDSSEHLIMGKYNPKYDNKNVSEIRHLMKHSNSTAKFEIGLREGFEMTTRNFNNKIRQKNVEESAFNKKNPMHRFH